MEKKIRKVEFFIGLLQGILILAGVLAFIGSCNCENITLAIVDVFSTIFLYLWLNIQCDKYISIYKMEYNIWLIASKLTETKETNNSDEI